MLKFDFVCKIFISKNIDISGIKYRCDIYQKSNIDVQNRYFLTRYIDMLLPSLIIYFRNPDFGKQNYLLP